MFVRVSCDRCRLSPAWTDDPAAILEGGCRHPVDCAARFADEQLADVKPDLGGGCHTVRPPPFPVVMPSLDAPLDRSHAGFWAAVIPCVAALLASLALASAYENALILPTLVELAAPLLAALLLYRAPPKATILPLLCLAGAALAIDTSGGARSAKPLGVLLLVTCAIVPPLLVDLELVDLGRLLRGGAAEGARVAATFAVMTVLLLVAEFPGARRIARHEDEAIVRSLIPRLRMQGSSLVLDQLDPRLATEAERRLSILAGGRRYELSAASTEVLVDSSTRTTSRDKERVTLVLPLQGRAIPDEVEIEGVRGPATTYETKVALAR